MIIEPIKEKIDLISKYIGTSTNEWVRVKVELVNLLPVKHRKLFSRRHKTSKKLFINPLEQEIIEYWKTITGVDLYIDPERLHKPEDERPLRGWAIFKRNEERHRLKNERLQKASKDN